MDYIKIAQDGSFRHGLMRGVALGEPPELKHQPREATLRTLTHYTFNNCDYIGTITLKGSHKIRNISNDMMSQFFLFIKIKDIINTYCQYYIINYEIHKCHEWIHSHFIFRPFRKSKVPQMRKEIYELIEGHSLNRKSYRNRILIEKPYKIENYITYIFKDYDDMKYLNLHSHYKLKSHPTIICHVLEDTTLKEEITTPKDISTEPLMK